MKGGLVWGDPVPAWPPLHCSLPSEHRTHWYLGCHPIDPNTAPFTAESSPSLHSLPGRFCGCRSLPPWPLNLVRRGEGIRG